MVARGVKTKVGKSTYPLSEAAAGERQGLRTDRLLLLLQRLLFIDKSRTPSVGTERNKQLGECAAGRGRRGGCALPTRRRHLDRWATPTASWRWGRGEHPARPWGACWGRGCGCGRATRRRRRRRSWKEEGPLRARWRWAGFDRGGCPEGGCFLRYIQRRTVGSFSGGFPEPLQECAGRRNSAHLSK